ncbi:MAG: dolichol-phosphate mannosyltransferase [Parcubacteria group bacterium Gr01-1014_8]|nr:MAG: dolichol-phosphate mannosyltransferase [Parcubacteria group bacterium Gr01-1014_8]
MGKPRVSLIVPVYNEALSLPLVHAAIKELYKDYEDMETIFVNDGSRDNSIEVLKKIAEGDKRVKVVSFSTNYGQTAAILGGIDHALGDIIIPMDSDLENDPRDIPKLVAELEKGYDVVSGWRQDRWGGSFFSRKLPSIAANWLISVITGVHLHDYGCTLKAYRKEVIKGVPLYGEMHRFIPAYASWQGAKVTEVPVRYSPRKFGKSNYGFSRILRVLLDLLLVRFLDRYMDRPIHFFGGLGIFLFLLGGLAGSAAIFLRIFYDLHMVQTPLPTLTALLLIMGMNLIMMGVLSEMQMRTYYEAKKERPYRIRETMNI